MQPNIAQKLNTFVNTGSPFLSADINLYENTLYSLKGTQEKHALELILQIKSRNVDDVYTSYYPKTYPVLEKNMPSVLKTQCFNYRGVPFTQEVTDTELGHLFEHILIQRLTELKKIMGCTVLYDGITSWDWTKSPYGLYKIHVNVSEKDTNLTCQALLDTIAVFNKVVAVK